MAPVSPFGTSYAAQSLGLSPNVTGGLDIAQVLKSQLATMAKNRAKKQGPPVQQGQPMSAAAFDVFGRTPGT